MNDPSSDTSRGDHDHDHGRDIHDHNHAEKADHTDEATTHGDSLTVQLDVPEMDCHSCASKVTASVEKLDGIRGIDTQPTSGTLSAHYDPERTDPSAITDRVEAAGYTIEQPDAERRETFEIPEMDCPSCANKVGNALEGVSGISSVFNGLNECCDVSIAIDPCLFGLTVRSSVGHAVYIPKCVFDGLLAVSTAHSFYSDGRRHTRLSTPASLMRIISLNIDLRGDNTS